MSDLVKRLRGYQESWWETIQRLDMGESDNGIMTTIRFEQHDTFKKAADILEQQAERMQQMTDENCKQSERIRVLVQLLADANELLGQRSVMADQARKDADRYRWLRVNWAESSDSWWDHGISAEELDAAIDAERKEGA